MTAEKDVLSVRESFVPPKSHVRTKKVFTARKVRRKDESLLGVLCAWVVEHQIGLSINLLSLLGLVHLFFPRARRRTRRFIELQYADQQTGLYERGWDDAYMVLFWIVTFTGLRAAVMDYVLKPFAQWAGIKSSKKIQTRFAEQAWMLLYYVVFWSVGMYIMYDSPYWLNMKEMWTNFPTHQMRPLVKWYYLVQFAFFLQQLFVINIEARRKDHWQMFAHHIFTTALLFCSYGFYQTKVGNVILCIMDVIDIILPFAKILNYLQFGTICDIAFGVFLVVWFITRHIFYPMVCWSIHKDVPTIMPYGCYNSVTGVKVSDTPDTSMLSNIMQSFNNPDGVVCFNERIRLSFLGLLLALQVITFIWFGMILRVAYGVLSGRAAEDVRSDDEDDVDEEEEVDLDWDEKSAIESAAESFTEPIELEVEADEVTGAFKTARSVSPAGRTRSQKKSAARASAISIPGHGDRKELLGRIGCDKPS